MIKYEVLTQTVRGVLPAVSLFNRQMKTDSGNHTLNVQYFKLFLKKEDEHVDVNHIFDDKSNVHWLNYYNALIELAVNNDLIIYEHEFGIYLLQKGIEYDELELHEFEKSLRPLKVEGKEALSARRFGLKWAGAQYNNPPKIRAIMPEKYIKMPKGLRYSLYKEQDERRCARLREREGIQRGTAPFGPQ